MPKEFHIVKSRINENDIFALNESICKKDYQIIRFSIIAVGKSLLLPIVAVEIFSIAPHKVFAIQTL